jgi:hypothetical protein
VFCQFDLSLFQVHQLGLLTQPFSVADQLGSSKLNRNIFLQVSEVKNDFTEAQSESAVLIVYRQRTIPCPVPRQRFMVEDARLVTSDRMIAVNEDTGFYVVDADKAVVFISPSPNGMYLSLSPINITNFYMVSRNTSF